MVIIMFEWKIKKLLRELKSDLPNKRVAAIQQLNHYKQQSSLKIQSKTLNDMIKVAAAEFPEPVAEWDNPSYYLIDFVADYPMPAAIDALIQNFDEFHIHAQYRAIQILLATENEQVFIFLESKIIMLIEKNRLELPIENIAEYPLLAKAIVEKTIHKLESVEHKFAIYELLLAVHRSGYAKEFKEETVFPILVEDYQKEKQAYLAYDEAYSPKFVYQFWKESYYFTRNRMILYLQLMEFYYSDEIKEEIQAALHFNDPFLKGRAILIAIEKDIPYDANLLIECAANIESAEFIYRQTIARNIEHLYPYPHEAQLHIAKTRLFFQYIYEAVEEPLFPEDIQVVDQVEKKLYRNVMARYYLVTFTSEGIVYAKWVGGFTRNENRIIEIVNHRDFEHVEFDSLDIAAYKEIFLKEVNLPNNETQRDIYYASSPKLSKITYFILFPIVATWLQIATGSEASIPLMTFITLIFGAYVVYNLVVNKRRKIIIHGEQIIKKDGSNSLEISISDIQEVKYTKRFVKIYDGNGTILMKIPIRWMNYRLFASLIREQATILTKEPYIQQ